MRSLPSTRRCTSYPIPILILTTFPQTLSFFKKYRHPCVSPDSPTSQSKTVLSRCGQCRVPVSSAICEISVIIISPQHSSSAPPRCRMHRRYNCRPHIPFCPALMRESLHIQRTPPPSVAGMSPRHDTLPHNIS